MTQFAIFNPLLEPEHQILVSNGDIEFTSRLRRVGLSQGLDTLARSFSPSHPTQSTCDSTRTPTSFSGSKSSGPISGSDRDPIDSAIGHAGRDDLCILSNLGSSILIKLTPSLFTLYSSPCGLPHPILRAYQAFITSGMTTDSPAMEGWWMKWATRGDFELHYLFNGYRMREELCEGVVIRDDEFIGVGGLDIDERWELGVWNSIRARYGDRKSCYTINLCGRTRTMSIEDVGSTSFIDCPPFKVEEVIERNCYTLHFDERTRRIKSSFPSIRRTEKMSDLHSEIIDLWKTKVMRTVKVKKWWVSIWFDRHQTIIIARSGEMTMENAVSLADSMIKKLSS